MQKKKKKDGIQIEPRVSLPEAFHREYPGAHAGCAVSAWNSTTKRRSARTARASNSVNTPPRAMGPKAEPGSSARWELSGRPADPTFVLGIKKENARNAWILC